MVAGRVRSQGGDRFLNVCPIFSLLGPLFTEPAERGHCHASHAWHKAFEARAARSLEKNN